MPLTAAPGDNEAHLFNFCYFIIRGEKRQVFFFRFLPGTGAQRGNRILNPGKTRGIIPYIHRIGKGSRYYERIR